MKPTQARLSPSKNLNFPGNFSSGPWEGDTATHRRHKAAPSRATTASLTESRGRIWPPSYLSSQPLLSKAAPGTNLGRNPQKRLRQECQYSAEEPRGQNSPRSSIMTEARQEPLVFMCSQFPGNIFNDHWKNKVKYLNTHISTLTDIKVSWDCL